eukprot:CAMPEP_0184303552 /NCGR_PEP_ID=MMETSP1049-20130417/13278_1 /TAXON_ID=77928 /ORGANISM="Proteomonas sulcata, Strain CCMP704" /LENGTH=135 /DNA_ID=CAMNT_0026615135 /DNA_START=1335 /DNA_END=1739 /DNA_ORIENTATION=+
MTFDRALGFTVQGAGFRVDSVSGLAVGASVEGLELRKRVLGLEFRVDAPGYQVRQFPMVSLTRVLDPVLIAATTGPLTPVKGGTMSLSLMQKLRVFCLKSRRTETTSPFTNLAPTTLSGSRPLPWYLSSVNEAVW